MLKNTTYVQNKRTPVLLDKRKLQSGPITLDNVFYVEHMISQGNATWHRITLVAVDSTEALQKSVYDIENTVAKELNYKGEVNGVGDNSLLVHPIFIRNLRADHRDIVETSEVTRISDELSAMINQEPDLMQYVVLGLNYKVDDPEPGLLLTKVAAPNAVSAIASAVIAVKDQLEGDFRPLFSTIKAPVTSEMFARYNAQAKHLHTFVMASPLYGKLPH